jgi:hypothetical protein
VEVHLLVAFEEAGEEQSIDVLGLRVGGVTRIQIRGIGFEEKGDGGRLGSRRVGAGGWEK